MQEGTFASGEMMLHGEDKPCLPAEISFLTEVDVVISVREGRFHQVRRMVASCGNHVKTLHRVSIGHLQLDGLEPGKFVHLHDSPLDMVQGGFMAQAPKARSVDVPRM
jgi:16S rRNA pseudouridine516 synthase